MKRHIDTELFVGGPIDGQRRRVLHGSSVVIPDPGDPHSHAAYRREELAGERVVLGFWVHSELDVDEFLARLARGYRGADAL